MSSEKPVLSIIIPFYNSESYIAKCLNSIDFESKNRLCFEIILINDGSTDKSLQIVSTYEKKYSFVKIYTQLNKGLSEARNLGIKKSQGKYLFFLDSDDWVIFSKLQELLQFSIEKDLDILSFNLQYFDENNTYLGTRQLQNITYNKINTGKAFLIEGYQPSSACLFLYKRYFLINNDLSFYPKISQQDVEFTVRLMLKAKRVYFSKKVVYNYYRHSGSITIPNNIQKLEKYLKDSISVAYLIKKNLIDISKDDIKLIKTIQKNYNSVVWNLLWRFLIKPKEVSYGFKINCIKTLQKNDLYPLKGSLKTIFQNIMSFFFNSTIYKLILRVVS